MPLINRRAVFKGLAAASVLAIAPFSLLEAPADAASAQAVAAIKTALRGDFITAGNMAQESGDMAAVKLVELIYLRDHGREVGFQRIRDFQAAAPKWPLSETLSKRAEQALYYAQEPHETVLGYFKDRQPLTADGHAALARAKLAMGQEKEARAHLRQAWAVTEMDGDTEKRIASEFGQLLSASDHKLRLQRLICAQQVAAATRHSKRLGAEGARMAKVAGALIRGVGGAEKQFAALPASLRSDPSMQYALARHYRKVHKFGRAREILLNAPSTAAGMVDASAWWDERRIIARRSIGPNHRDTWNAAYKIASRHGFSKGEDAVDAEFLSGWIALRYLKDASTARAHFERLISAASTRTEKARGGYWLGRAHLALGDKAAADKAFRSAAQHSTVYYGQLAREYLGLGKVPEEINSGDASSAAQARVRNDEVIRAMRIMHAASGQDNLHMFLWSIASRFESVDEMNAAAAIVHSMGGTTLALRLAKAAGQFKIDIDSWSYPLRGLPDWKQIGKPVEKALVFALSRQESEFNPKAGSRVGAQGLMQLMPATAKLVARQHGLPYVQSKLTGDPVYNVKLGAAHLGDLIADYNGSYVLTLVAYNAGPRRVREWVEEFGDPRGGQVDAIDWVESIPFSETRQYVQKVLQNLHVYRSRLAPSTVRPMTADLKRGSPAGIEMTASFGPVADDCGGDSITQIIKRCD